MTCSVTIKERDWVKTFIFVGASIIFILAAFYVFSIVSKYEFRDYDSVFMLLIGILFSCSSATFIISSIDCFTEKNFEVNCSKEKTKGG